MNTPIDCLELPSAPSTEHIYRLLPQKDESFYRERTDRNIGWISREEQEKIHKSVVCIAGCGGMGGLLASIFVRLGVGEVRIADCEVFDTSNINRQFAATRDNIEKSKAFETARMVRAISDDTTLVVYPQGITENTVLPFIEGASVVCDEIEFWAVGSRILLHQVARREQVGVYNCNTVGFGTRLFFFEPEGYTMEELLRLSYQKAASLQEKIQKKEATKEEIAEVMEAVLEGLVPEIPEYSSNISEWSTVENGRKRLFEEGKAMIIATNPPMAAGFLADHVLFYLLRDSVTRRNVARPVPAPGYLYFDAGHHTAKAVRRT